MNNSKETARNVEWYMRLYDQSMGEKYKELESKVTSLIKDWKTKSDDSLIAQIHQLLPIPSADN